MTFDPENEGPPALLPGESAVYWMRHAAIGFFGFLPAPVLLLIGSQAHDPLRALAFTGAIGIGLVSLGWVLRAGLYLMQAERREVQAGYTTLYSARYRHLWQLDPRTGAVIRPPEPRR